MTHLKAKLQKNWGLLAFWFMSAFGLFKVMMEHPLSGHYRIFTGAARLLWAKQDPYEFDFQSVGYWFYSQSCGLFFFSWFAFLPPALGLFIYSLFSILIFYWASMRFLKWSGSETLLQPFYFFTSIAVYQALLAAKVETVMVSVILLSVTLFFSYRDKRTLLDIGISILLGAILEWKFQPAPILGLLSVVLILKRKNWVPVIGVALSALIWHYLPALWLGQDLFQNFLGHQTRSLGDFISTSYSHYDNLYKFLDSVHLPISFRQSLILSALVGVTFFVRTLIGALRKEEEITQAGRALMFGSVFIMTLSPMAQNNASIFLVPVIWFALLRTRNSDAPKWHRSSHYFFLVFLSFAYSDLVPKAAREFLRTYSLKSVVILLFAYLCVFERSRVGSRSSH
jgi:hypothetical protein